MIKLKKTLNNEFCKYKLTIILVILIVKFKLRMTENEAEFNPNDFDDDIKEDKKLMFDIANIQEETIELYNSISCNPNVFSVALFQSVFPLLLISFRGLKIC